jgi:hypothetical protein
MFGQSNAGAIDHERILAKDMAVCQNAELSCSAWIEMVQK